MILHYRYHFSSCGFQLLVRTTQVASTRAPAGPCTRTRGSHLEKIERRELHPAMAAYGLWREKTDLAELTDEIAAERLKPTTRPNLDL
jgi:hypothetical protein